LRNVWTSPIHTHIQLFDENAAELEEGRSPVSILAVAVMLQRNRSPNWDAGQQSIVKHPLTIERDGQAVSFHEDMEGIPLADGPVRPDLGRD
jgi:hypothetical protein